MILFALSCAGGHAFEGWFSNNGSYEDQSARGLISCPTCGSNAVSKAVMAPSVRKASEPKRTSPDAERSAWRYAMGAEDVGKRFAAEARRIHDGEAETRPIRGVATREDARTLLEEGIAVFPIPDAPH